MGRRATTLSRRAAQAVLLPLGLLAAAGVAAQPQAALPAAAGPTAAGYLPAQRTALATRHDLQFVLARRQDGDARTTVLAWLPPAGPPEPVARLDQVHAEGGLAVTVHLSAPGLTADATVQDALPQPADRLGATLEQLYALLLRQEPEARYCLLPRAGAPDTGPPPCAGPLLSHADALHRLAIWRAQAVQATPAALPWQVLTLQAAPQPSWDADLVAVQASGPQGPLADVEIHFNRAPHSICRALTGVDGVARCRLQDQHADGHLHDHAAAVVATFPGELRPDRVWLPTTQVLRRQADGTAPAFASRWQLPGAEAGR